MAQQLQFLYHLTIILVIVVNVTLSNNNPKIDASGDDKDWTCTKSQEWVDKWNLPNNLNLIDFEKQALETVNFFRGIHNMRKEACRLSYRVVKIAAERFKEHIHLALQEELPIDDDDRWGRSMGVIYGKDVMKWKDFLHGGMAARYWYHTQAHAYDYNQGVQNITTEHFVQMVWNDTTEFGASFLLSNFGDMVIVYLYSPYGNWGPPRIMKAYMENARVDVRTSLSYMDEIALHLFPNNTLTNKRKWMHDVNDYHW